MVGCGSRKIFENINVNLEEIDLHSNIFAFSGKLHGRRSALAKLVSNLVHICSHQVDRQDGQDVLRPPGTYVAVDHFSVVHFVIHKILRKYPWIDDLAPFDHC